MWIPTLDPHAPHLGNSEMGTWPRQPIRFSSGALCLWPGCCAHTGLKALGAVGASIHSLGMPPAQTKHVPSGERGAPGGARGLDPAVPEVSVWFLASETEEFSFWLSCQVQCSRHLLCCPAARDLLNSLLYFPETCFRSFLCTSWSAGLGPLSQLHLQD